MDIDEEEDGEIAEYEVVLYKECSARERGKRSKLVTIEDINNLEKDSVQGNQAFLAMNELKKYLKQDKYNNLGVHMVYRKNFIAKTSYSLIKMKFLKQDNISWKIDHSMENYTSENVLKLTLNGLKKDKYFEIYSYNVIGREVCKYRYCFLLVGKVLIVKVLLPIDKIHKVWKYLEIPYKDYEIKIEIIESSHHQVTIHVNEFRIALSLRLPIIHSSFYVLLNPQNNLIETIYLLSNPISPEYCDPNQDYCTKYCILI